MFCSTLRHLHTVLSIRSYAHLLPVAGSLGRRRRSRVSVCRRRFLGATSFPEAAWRQNSSPTLGAVRSRAGRALGSSSLERCLLASRSVSCDASLWKESCPETPPDLPGSRTIPHHKHNANPTSNPRISGCTFSPCPTSSGPTVLSW